MAIVFPRNVVQDWLSDNKKFIQSPNKSINFTYSISHPEYKGEYENLKGQLITASEEKFKLTMGPRTIYSNGDKYVGEYKDGKYHGQGTFNRYDGSKYVGGFRYGELNGQGTLTFPDGRKYEGEWKDGKPWNGILSDKKGNILYKIVNGI